MKYIIKIYNKIPKTFRYSKTVFSASSPVTLRQHFTMSIMMMIVYLKSYGLVVQLRNLLSDLYNFFRGVLTIEGNMDTLFESFIPLRKINNLEKKRIMISGRRLINKEDKT